VVVTRTGCWDMAELLGVLTAGADQILGFTP